ncbi:MAG TPA: methyltransferase [Methylomirabilota bacterium]|nr:methyltransferase [Methylomirabilota bacterium]
MNAYDDYRPDVAALLAAQDKALRPPSPTARSGDGLGLAGRLAGRARLYALALAVRLGLHRRLVYASLRLAWFEEFQAYWVGELGNRPIHPADFFHLYGVYRQRLQTIDFEGLSNPDLASDDRHLAAWRDHRLTYYLFAHTYRQALSPLQVHRWVRFVPRGGRVAEYGCGAAPVLTALARRYRHLDLQLVGADIPHLLFHYARWRLRDRPYVTMVRIEPGDDAPLPGAFDTIFCQEVLEHLPRPLPVLRHLHAALRPGGCLVFDYVRSEGTGLDTAASLRDRLEALRFILASFEVVAGEVPLDGAHVATTVVRKRTG